MAERRMFAMTIADSDAFLGLPLSAQALYFHLSMRADDDGFVNNPRTIQRMIGANDSDCETLLKKKFILGFDSGIVVIKHWKVNNYIQKDRYKPTVYQDEKALLEIKSNGVYTWMDTGCIQNGYTDVDTGCIQNGYTGKYSIGKYSIDKSSVVESIDASQSEANAHTKRFKPPTFDEVRAYCSERGGKIDAERFVDYYATNGWRVGKNPMKDWKAAVRNWERRERDKITPPPAKSSSFDEDDFFEAALAAERRRANEGSGDG